jgi:cyanophycinase-like exopeptidase
VFVLLLAGAAAQAGPTRYLSGNPADAMGDVARLAGPVLDLGGGGPDVDAAILAMIDGVRGCAGDGAECPAHVDVVVLRAGGADGYNDYILAMPGVDSVETLVVAGGADADDPAVEASVRNAEIVFFAGGDQCDYVRHFRGRRVEAAVEAVYARGGGIGGTSAGMAIQSPIVYDACRDGARSADILADPYHPSATFTTDFLAWRELEGTLTDQHFAARDRMGRLLGFLARQVADGVAPDGVLGVAADERSSIVVDRAGVATVLGEGNAYFVLADHAPGSRDARERVAAGEPLSYFGYRVWRIAPGGRFDLRNRPATGAYTLDVLGGRIVPENPY